MPMKTKVKVGNITNLSDARYCAGMGVDFLGFPVSSNNLSQDLLRFKDISSWVSGPFLVIEWQEPTLSPDQLQQILGYNAQYMEINAEAMEDFHRADINLIVKLDISTDQGLYDLALKNKTAISMLVLTSSAFDIPSPATVERMAKDFDILLGFGIKENTLDDILALPIMGISITGGHEDKPGLSDYTGLAAILEKLEID
jgi:phosphoribosylanthranilate isomerase